MNSWNTEGGIYRKRIQILQVPNHLVRDISWLNARKQSISNRNNLQGNILRVRSPLSMKIPPHLKLSDYPKAARDVRSEVPDSAIRTDT